MGNCLNSSRKSSNHKATPGQSSAANFHAYESSKQSFHANQQMIKERWIVRAVYDFDGLTEEDLVFRKGDQLEVDEESRHNPDWWIACHLATGQRGYIPSNYVTKDDNSPEAQDWWHDVNRQDAEKFLLLAGNPTGTFLVRQAGDKASYVLSVRDFDYAVRDASVKHYRIQRLDNGGFFISPRKSFANMIDLIFHYQGHADGLCCKLDSPCPKTPPKVQFRDLEVPRESVRLQKKLGAGSFGEVYSGTWRGAVKVAVKTLKTGEMSVHEFLEEAKLMHRLRHKRLVQLLAVCTQTEPIWIITELMVNGALLQYLRTDEAKKLTFKQLAEMASQVAEGMAYLEVENFVHRDLRAANILVGQLNDVKVADFGLARIIADGEYNAGENTKFPVKWTAPEAVFHRKFSIKSDIWSFGVLLYEIITFGSPPYPGMSGQEVLTRVEDGYRIPKPVGGPILCPDGYYAAMKKCWLKEPESRPTFAYLKDYFDTFYIATENEYAKTN